ncbi:hypothetical protein MLD38_034455 [Melastoma candidum]|uniref:Uncharacterized protein n=1 Tax=Melastoma candidum TaxID=119954 RepID=A0ACB9MC29_9MYRT|nr:hypothetical protein MLD38_034455 [Melastoma candidum]
MVSVYFITFIVALVGLVLTRYGQTCDKEEGREDPPPQPGSVGWPYIGEILQFYYQDRNVYFANKDKRYGEIFKTRTRLSQRAADVTGGSQGEYHTRLWKLVQSSLSPEVIRNMVGDVEAVLLSTLELWDGGKVVNTLEEMKKFSFEVGILAVFGNLEGHFREELKKNYCMVDRGCNCFPSNFPGTQYRKALLARNLDRIICETVFEKKEKRFNEKNLLGCPLDYRDEKGKILDDAQIVDNIIGVLFAARDTTANIMTWLIKHLHENTKLLEAVKLVMETLRMATIISLTFQETVADIEYKGKRHPHFEFKSIHHNPEFFPNPDTFDPSRFEVSPKPYTFMPFGVGVHSCPGNELAKLEIMVLVHHLVTKFSGKSWVNTMGSSTAHSQYDRIDYQPGSGSCHPKEKYPPVSIQDP